MSQQKDEFEKLITRNISQLSHEINRVKEENLELHKTVRDLSERLEQFEDTSAEQFFESIKKRKKFWEIVRKKLEGSLYEDVMSFGLKSLIWRCLHLSWETSRADMKKV